MDSEEQWMDGQRQTPSEPLVTIFDGAAVLDIGCGTGKDLMHSAFAKAARLCGLDPSADQISYGKNRYPNLELVIGIAERLPYASAQFDFVVSRVSLPYTDIQVALLEIHRVLKPCAKLAISMHGSDMWLKGFKRTVRQYPMRGLAKYTYILIASIGFALSGRVMKQPWGTGRESFQTERGLRRVLKRAGFYAIRFRYRERDWIITATKSP